MKFAGIVLRNVNNPLGSVNYEPVFDALLSGGVFLDEIVFLPYNAPSEISSCLSRLYTECEGVYLVCDKVLLSSAKSAVSLALGAPFEEEYLLETQSALTAVLPDGARGASLVETDVIPRTDRRRRNSYCRVVVRSVFAPADLVGGVLERIRERAGDKLYVHFSEKYGDQKTELIYDANTPKMTVDDAVRLLATELGDYIYAMDDTSLAQRLVEALKLHRLHLSTAESFTAGGVGGEIVRVPGASSVFFEGLNAYDNKAKAERLNVSEFTLKSKGAVSDETAYEMAAGLLAGGNCDVAISTTGIAGPKSDGTQKPVGLCFLGVGTKERVRVYRFQLTGDREAITKTAINLALFYAYLAVK